MKTIFSIIPTGYCRDKSRFVPTVIPFIILIFILRTSDLSGQEYAIGADLSFLKSAEDKGFSFKENDIAKPGHGQECRTISW